MVEDLMGVFLEVIFNYFEYYKDIYILEWCRFYLKVYILNYI